VVQQVRAVELRADERRRGLRVLPQHPEEIEAVITATPLT
jgi:hypothetical protein